MENLGRLAPDRPSPRARRAAAAYRGARPVRLDPARGFAMIPPSQRPTISSGVPVLRGCAMSQSPTPTRAEPSSRRERRFGAALAAVVLGGPPAAAVLAAYHFGAFRGSPVERYLC